MSDFLDRINKLSPKRLALLALDLNEQLKAAQSRRRTPIAIVGLACRFPGASDDAERFWELLREGRDAIVDVPPDRWDADAWFDADPDAPGRMSVRNGGFLQAVDQFEPGFFGISPREALTMDPQQRLLLEVTWQALERAGMSPERLAGSSTGVFVGVCNSDYFQRVMGRGIDAIDAYLASGNAHSVAAGRISYTLGLQGPAVAIDTACSSSLVALHAACQSLRNGEVGMAICGGVNLMCSPETTITLTKSHMLAPDGRCKTFDESADGFARGEGCGVLLLKRLDDALAAGDRVLAVVRGTATNQDGRSGGLTVPNGPAQEAVIRAALADAGVQPADVGYVEAHGTGTSLGDPIEVRALAGVFGPGRDRATPLWVGSVKTNIGHLESAAGIAGIIKVVLSLQHERLPRHLHFNHPSPHIPWADFPIAVPAEGRDWPRGERPRIAGVSSFGFSGTNAHIVIEEAPLAAAAVADGVASPAVDRPLHCLPLSARTPAALREQAKRVADALEAQPQVSLADVAHTLGVGRSHLLERAAIVAGDVATARAALRELAAGAVPAAGARGTIVPGQPPEVVFLFTGQGAQYPGMAQALYEASPVFRDVIDRCDAQLGPDAQGRTLKSVIWSGDQEPAPVHETAWTQPALFAVEYGLTQLWRSWGIEPAAVIGHSVGEYVAACVAGVFSLEDGIRLIAERGRLMQALPPGGSMAAIFAPASEVEAAVAPLQDRVAIAAYNAADSVVISGESTAVESLLADFARRNIQGHRLYVALAGHSPLVAPALDAMERCAASVPMQAPRIPVAWNVTGGALPQGSAPDASYWRRHLREPVRFAEGIATLYRDGFRTFLEVGPHPTLLALAQRSLPEQGVTCYTSLRRGKDDWRELLSSLAALYVQGANVDWPGVDGPYPRQRLPLPTYPFERKSFWIAGGAQGQRAFTARRGGPQAMRPVRLPTAAPIFETVLTPQSPAYLDAHRLKGAVLVAGPVLIELAQHCARALSGQPAAAVEQFAIANPLVLPPEGRVVQVQLQELAPRTRSFTVSSAPVDAPTDWLVHATGRLCDAASERAAPAAAAPASLAAPFETVDGAAHYERLAALGIDLAADFRSVRSARRRDGEAFVELALPARWRGEAMAWAHPVLLDGAMQAAGLALPDAGDDDAIYLLTEVDAIELRAPLPAELSCSVRLRAATTPRPAEWRADVELTGPGGQQVGALRGVALRRASREALARIGGSVEAQDGIHYAIDWQPAPVCPAAAPFMAGPAAVAVPLRESFATLAAENGMAVYAPLLQELDRLSLRHVAVALAALGFDSTPGRVFTVDAEATRLGVIARQARLFGRLLDMLAEDGLLGRRAQGFEVVARLPGFTAEDPYAPLLARFAPVDGELLTLRRCGPHLADVLAGRQDPLQLLFPGGSFAEARQLYVESPFARTYNGALAAAIESSLRSLPADSRLRVLEIGAGTGGTTTYVLPRLPATRTDYTFTDVSPLFLERAAEQFRDYPFMQRALLDIERDPLAQGFQAGGYDIVIAANVLHATADLRATVQHATRLLAPGGWLLLLEGVAPQRWVDLTFGLTEGWWRFTDAARRPAYPLIDREAWVRLLQDCGLGEVEALPATAGDAAMAQQALLLARAPLARRDWTILGDAQGLGAALARRLRARGDRVTAAAADAAEFAAEGDLIYLGAIELGAMEDTGDGARLARASTELAGSVAVTALARFSRRDSGGRAWFVTQDAQPLQEPASALAAFQAPALGIGRAFALEHPERWGGSIDLPPSVDRDALADAVLAAIDGAGDEDQLALRDGRWFAPRLVHRPLPATPPAALHADATYLVTGGFGGLGVVAARWLVERGARHIALLGRSARPDSDAQRELEAMGARVLALQGDVGDAASMAAVMQQIAAQAPPLRGILHCAADLGAAPIRELGADQVARMFRPKLDGTVILERLTRGSPLDFLVLFSSTTALLGASGLAHYAAANAFLDAFAVAHDAPGRRVLSVNWGTWEVMRLASAESQREYRASGLEPMSADEALDALGRLLQGDAPQAVVARIDWNVLKPLHESRRVRPLLEHLGTAGEAPRAASGTADAAALAVQLTGIAAADRRDVILRFVSAEVAGVLGRDPSEPIAPAVGLFDLGMDSLMSVELRRRLERGVGRSLPSTLTFNYPNVDALTGFIEAELGSTVASEPVPVAPPAAATPPVPAGELAELSDDELEARLLARLSEVR